MYTPFVIEEFNFPIPNFQLTRKLSEAKPKSFYDKSAVGILFKEKILDAVEKDPKLMMQLQKQISQMITSIYHGSQNSSDGFCYKFSLPHAGVIGLLKIFNIDPHEMEIAFRKDWEYPPGTKMYSDPYYQSLLLFVTLGLVKNNKALAHHAELLVLTKIWNGRRQEFIPHCNINVMRYVVKNMLSKKYHIAKHDTPLDLLGNLFAPTLLTKYGTTILEGIGIGLKKLFMQNYSRIYQIFRQQVATNPATGKKEAQGGLATLYYRAVNDGLSVRDASVVTQDDDKDPSFEDFGTTNPIDDLAREVTDFIVMNPNSVYPEQFMKHINKITHVSIKVLYQISKAIHKIKYHDMINDLIVLLISRINIKNKQDICSVQFMLDLKKKVISSKNNQDVNKITSILNSFLSSVFKELGYNFDNYSSVNKIQIRSSLLHIIVFNMKRVVCHQQLTQQINMLSKLENELMMPGKNFNVF